MNLTKWMNKNLPFTRNYHFIDDIEKAFHDFTADITPTMHLDAKDTSNELIIKAELPGLKKEDINVKLSDHYLIIQAEKKEDKEEQDQYNYLNERKYGFIQRVIPLNNEIDTDHSDVTYLDGILTIKLPKIPGEKSNMKKLDIK